MKPFLRNQLERYAQRLGELDFLLSREDIMSDMAQYRRISVEHAEVTQVAGRYARYQQREADLAGAREMLADPDMAEMAQEEITSAEAELLQLEDELQRLLLPKDPDDARNAFVEIRAGTGGDESALFAGDLTRMYTRYAANVGWKSWLSVVPRAPAVSAARTASFIWPRICASPSTIESSPLATRNAWRATRLSSRV